MADLWTTTMCSSQGPKKKYSPPMVIEIGIETVTGFGASHCIDGPDISNSSCSPGNGAGYSCADGWGVSTACGSGGNPYESGSFCNANGLSASTCQSGSAAVSGSSRCVMGTTASHSSATTSCINGPDEQNICGYGNHNITARFFS